MAAEKLQWCVITDTGWSPETGASPGNLCNSSLYTDMGLTTDESMKASGMFLTEVFEQGELLLLNELGREVLGAGRKPDKWDVEYELFPYSELDTAVKRALEVTRL